MKYTITESRLKSLVFNYLDSFSKDKKVSVEPPFMTLHDFGQVEAEVETTYFSYNFNGNFWINPRLTGTLSYLFNLPMVTIYDFASEWFKKKYLHDMNKFTSEK